MSELRKLHVREGALVVLPSAIIAGARDIDIEPGGVLIAREDPLTPDEIEDLIRAMRGLPTT